MKNELIDKALLFLCGLFFVIVLGENEDIVVASLISIVIVLVPNLQFGINYKQEIFGAFYILAGIKWIVCLPFYPVICYDFFKKKRYKLVICCVLVLGYYFFVKQNIYETVSSIKEQRYICVVVLLVLLISGRMAVVSSKGQILEEKLKKIRDDGKEKENLLKERNLILLEQQNVEINMATLKERNRIAREIHDNVGHMLTRAILQTGALKVLEKDENLKAQLNVLQETLNTAMNNIRQSVHDLHDESINFEKAVNELIEAFPKLDITFVYEVDGKLDKSIKYGFLAIIKESLTNTIKHSNGEKVKLIIKENPGFYQLFIEDNGTNISENFVGGMGLCGIKERVEKLNGMLRISTENGFGITVTILK
ncbi:sensor histidine kinase [Lachnobacterium bovis]|uniref:histidine kinase n=1 Tax=Lachnobacterium bovis TaxID=140626 RepID=A0A1H9TA72_9FIRM|nr:sensor histidine kinase [Lachnobacterium bovis]SER94132.1 Signal transduction histidine kinase [Lachnobacterium bovis]